MAGKIQRGGRRAGAGRPQGAATKRTREVANAAAANGLTPLEYMLRLMRDEKVEQSVRLDAAKSAAPFVHPRLSATTIRGDANEPLMLGLSSADELRAKVRGDNASPGDTKLLSASPPPVEIHSKPAPRQQKDKLAGFRDQAYNEISQHA